MYMSNVSAALTFSAVHPDTWEWLSWMEEDEVVEYNDNKEREIREREPQSCFKIIDIIQLTSLFEVSSSDPRSVGGCQKPPHLISQSLSV